MGDASRAILNGEVCQECGEAFMDDAPGHPRSCGRCDPDGDDEPFTDDEDDDAGYGLDDEDEEDDEW